MFGYRLGPHILYGPRVHIHVCHPGCSSWGSRSMSHPTLSPMRLAVNILATLPLLSLLWPLYCLLFCASSLQVGHTLQTLQPEVLQCRLLQLAQSLRGQGLQSNLVLISLKGANISKAPSG